MANIQSNPWSFTSADPATAAISAISIAANGVVSVTSAALTFNLTVEPPLGFTIIGSTPTAYNGFYFLQSGVSGGTTFGLVPQFSIPTSTGAGSTGTLIQCLYRSWVRIEDLSWQGLAAAGATGSLDIRDRNGNILWQASLNSASTGGTNSAGQQNRGKLFWVNGLSPNVIAANTILLATVN
jgi:hypothetical protein